MGVFDPDDVWERASGSFEEQQRAAHAERDDEIEQPRFDEEARLVRHF
jgi:hypothetical protein